MRREVLRDISRTPVRQISTVSQNRQASLNTRNVIFTRLGERPSSRLDIYMHGPISLVDATAHVFSSPRRDDNNSVS